MVADAAAATIGLQVSRSPGKVLGRQTRTPWREQALARTAELMSLLNWFQELPAPEQGQSRYLEDGARDKLCHETAEQLMQVAETTHRKLLGLAVISGAAVERAFGLLNAAEANVLRLAPARYVLSVVPNLCARAQLSLPDSDPRVQLLKDIATVTKMGVRAGSNAAGEILPDATRAAIIAAVEGANAASRVEQLRVRSFRNVILSTAAAATVLGLIIAVIGAVYPSWAPICFEPQGEIVCPTTSVAISAHVNPIPTIQNVATGFDTIVVIYMGVLGAAISAAAALRGMRSSADPYSLPVALAILKLPVGGLTAVLGLLLISAGFVPGLSALDSPAQIIAWAVILGYAQQLFTRFVDSQARTVLAQVQANSGANLNTNGHSA